MRLVEPDEMRRDIGLQAIASRFETGSPNPFRYLSSLARGCRATWTKPGGKPSGGGLSEGQRSNLRSGRIDMSIILGAGPAEAAPARFGSLACPGHEGGPLSPGHESDPRICRVLFFVS